MGKREVSQPAYSMKVEGIDIMVPMRGGTRLAVEPVEWPGDLEPALDRVLKHPGPAVLEVMVKPLEPRP